MRSVGVLVSGELSKEHFRFFHLLEMQLTNTYRYTDSDIPVYVSGEKFTPIGVKISDISVASALSVDRITVEIDDADHTVSDVLISEDARNKTAIFSVGVFDDNLNVIGTEDLFRGMVGEWEYEEPTSKVTIVNEFVLWKKRPLRSASGTCAWVFRGTECGYTPSGECDQSYDRCVALGNSNNFGGFRFLPSLQEARIWWGRTPE